MAHASILDIEQGDYEYLQSLCRCRTMEAIPLVSESHKSSDFINLLKKLDNKYPEGDVIRIICDNHSAHKSKETKNYLFSCVLVTNTLLYR